jgi:polygalacturonase
MPATHPTSLAALLVAGTAAAALAGCGGSGGAPAQARGSDAALASLAVSGGTLRPAFSPEVTRYTVAAPYGTAAIRVTPAVRDGGARIAVSVDAGASSPLASGSTSGPVALPTPPATTVVRVTVTAGDGATTRSYELTAARQSGDDARLASLVDSAGALTGFSPDTFDYPVAVPSTVATVAVTATPVDPLIATVTVNGARVAAGAASSFIPLAPDAVTTVTVTAVAEDGVHTRSYHLYVRVLPPAAVETPWGTVAAPELPATVCTTLAAALTPANGSLDAEDASSLASKPDQSRIQAAIDACATASAARGAPGAVRLAKGPAGESAFLTGPLQLRSWVVLQVDAGVTLFGSRNPADYDRGAGTCGTATVSSTKSCNPLIAAVSTTHSGIMGDGVVDGRGGSLLTSGPNATGTPLRTWWDVAYQSESGLNQQVPRMIQVTGGDHFSMYRVTVQNSPNFHVVTDGVAGVTLWSVKILTPSLVYTVPGYACPAGSRPDQVTPATCFTPDTAKNTDGFDPGASSSVLMAYSWVSVGDDDVAVKAGNGPARGLAFLHDHFFYGHGMSIGSETNAGVSDVLVEDLSVDGRDSPNGNGLRIKSDSSRGGSVDRVTYRGICMKNVRRPLVFDAFYSSASGSAIPRSTNVLVQDFHDLGSASFGGGVNTFAGYGASWPLGITLDNVVFDGTQPTFQGAHNGSLASPSWTAFTLGPGPVSFGASIVPDAATGVSVTARPGPGSAPRDCATAFPSLSSVVPTSPL